MDGRTSPSLDLSPTGRTMRRKRMLGDGQPASCLRAKERHHAGTSNRSGRRRGGGGRGRPGRRRSPPRARGSRTPLRRLDRPVRRARAVEGSRRCAATQRLSRALRVARGRPPKGFPDPRTGVVPDASTLISTDYNGANMSGTLDLTWTVSNTNGCNGGFQYSAASMPSGWNDRVSSSQSAHGCALERPLPQHQLRRCGDHLHLLDDGRDEQPDLQRDLEPVTAAAGGPRAGPPAMPVRRPCHTARSSGTP